MRLPEAATKLLAAETLITFEQGRKRLTSGDLISRIIRDFTHGDTTFRRSLYREFQEGAEWAERGLSPTALQSMIYRHGYR